VNRSCLLAWSLVIVIGAPLLGQEANRDERARCKAVHADLVEDGGTVGCKPGHPDCYLGEVDGNHGLRGTTYFRADSLAAGPRTSPGFISYSGQFEYTTGRGTIITRETGVFDTTTGRPSSGAVTAYQQIVSGTGDFQGATGYFFVSGYNRNLHVVTKVTGEICTSE
jgi:hypothetical protein